MFKVLPVTSPSVESVTPQVFTLVVQPQSERERETVLLVNREEHHSIREGKLLRARITFHYQVISPRSVGSSNQGGEFSASYDCGFVRDDPWVRLTSASVDTGGYCVVDPGWLAGRGVGTYFMNLIVQWVQQWPDAGVMPIRLLASDASGVNRKRRNRFYEQFGISFNYDCEGKKSGSSCPMKVGELSPLSVERLESLANKVIQKPLDAHMSEKAQEIQLLEMEVWGLKNQVKQGYAQMERASRAPFLWAAATRWTRLWRGY